MHGATIGRYEHELRQQTGELNDLFLLLCFMEATALPNPATLYLLEVYPVPPRAVSPSGTGGWASSIRRSAACRAAERARSTSRSSSSAGRAASARRPARSAFALAASRAGDSVLLVSTDPAHSTTDIFEKPIGDVGARAAAGSDRRSRSTPRQEARALHRRRQAATSSGCSARRRSSQAQPADRNGGGVARPARSRAARSHDRPHRRPQRAYDLIVFDTAPTGHTLQLLRMPDAITTWIQALVRHRRALLEIDRGGEQTRARRRRADPVLAALERRHERLTELRRSSPIAGARRSCWSPCPSGWSSRRPRGRPSSSPTTGIDVGGLIVNRVLPDGLEGEFYRRARRRKRIYLKEIESRFSRLRASDRSASCRGTYTARDRSLTSAPSWSDNPAVSCVFPALWHHRTRYGVRKGARLPPACDRWRAAARPVPRDCGRSSTTTSICHLKTPLHCTSCASSRGRIRCRARRSIQAPAAVRDAGRAVAADRQLRERCSRRPHQRPFAARLSPEIRNTDSRSCMECLRVDARGRGVPSESVPLCRAVAADRRVARDAAGGGLG